MPSTILCAQERVEGAEPVDLNWNEQRGRVYAELDGLATVIANDSSKGRGQSDRYTGMMIAGHALAGVLLITSGISWWLYYRSLRPRAEEPRTAFSVMPQRDGFALAMQLRF